MIRGALSKFHSVFVVYLKDCLAYPATVFLWVYIESVNAIVLPAVWLAAAAPGQSIAGFSPSQMVTYYLLTTTLSQFIVCHLMWDIGWDIREGWMTTFLLRPMGFFWMSAARNLSWRVMKILCFIPLLIVMLLLYPNIDRSAMHLGWTFWASVILAHTLSFVMAYCLAMIPFWTTEFFSIFRLYYVPELFFSGRLIPLQTMPEWIQRIADWTPFPYTIAFPAEIALDRLSPTEVSQGLQIQVLYIAIFVALGGYLYKKGSRQYTGVGM